jgi:carbonic anhydrase/acetyltransferase-like protein (isoleucine patch superfamily)
MGAPGKVIRQLSDQEAAMIRMGCVQYTERAGRYKRELQRVAE